MSDHASVMNDKDDCQRSRTDALVDVLASAIDASSQTVARQAVSVTIAVTTVAALVAALRLEGTLSSEMEHEMWRFVSTSIGFLPEHLTALADSQLSLMQQSAGFLPPDGDSEK